MHCRQARRDVAHWEGHLSPLRLAWKVLENPLVYSTEPSGLGCGRARCMASFVIALRVLVEGSGLRNTPSRRSRVFLSSLLRVCFGRLRGVLRGSAGWAGGWLRVRPVALGRELLHVLTGCSQRCRLAAWLPSLPPGPSCVPGARAEQWPGTPWVALAVSPGLPLSLAQTPASLAQQPLSFRWPQTHACP